MPISRSESARCDHCLKPDGPVAVIRLVGAVGPDLYMCADCLAVCLEYATKMKWLNQLRATRAARAAKEEIPREEPLSPGTRRNRRRYEWRPPIQDADAGAPEV